MKKRFFFVMLVMFSLVPAVFAEEGNYGQLSFRDLGPGSTLCSEVAKVIQEANQSASVLKQQTTSAETAE